VRERVCVCKKKMRLTAQDPSQGGGGGGGGGFILFNDTTEGRRGRLRIRQGAENSEKSLPWYIHSAKVNM
jgi:hypothetical protein